MAKRYTLVKYVVLPLATLAAYFSCYSSHLFGVIFLEIGCFASKQKSNTIHRYKSLHMIISKHEGK